ncbi:hypothetical protein P154DRAFT_219725 [Amniculicola lignicola CBS 123094]|uniref:Uncharacterized protein n=1 Tax=Amniculicola lignicola CBS 123094 TaxID=1392246 RepID=A0A6A5X1A1_9PLEO|nr:hypothetical protein P154DRAFT_219725 [Amniculicola lignicola CBS 123094]
MASCLDIRHSLLSDSACNGTLVKIGPHPRSLCRFSEISAHLSGVRYKSPAERNLASSLVSYLEEETKRRELGDSCNHFMPPHVVSTLIVHLVLVLLSRSLRLCRAPSATRHYAVPLTVGSARRGKGGEGMNHVVPELYPITPEDPHRVPTHMLPLPRG